MVLSHLVALEDAPEVIKQVVGTEVGGHLGFASLGVHVGAVHHAHCGGGGQRRGCHANRGLVGLQGLWFVELLRGAGGHKHSLLLLHGHACADGVDGGGTDHAWRHAGRCGVLLRYGASNVGVDAVIAGAGGHGSRHWQWGTGRRGCSNPGLSDRERGGHLRPDVSLGVQRGLGCGGGLQGCGGDGALGQGRGGGHMNKLLSTVRSPAGTAGRLP